MDQPDPGKLSSLHFYAWSKGLKTGMYYLRTRVVADAIKFTVDTSFLNKVYCLNSCAGLAWFCSVFGAEWSASCRKNVLLRADVYSNVLLGFFWSWTDCCGCLLLEASFRMISVTGRTTIIDAMVLVDNLQESGLRRFVHHYVVVASGLGGWLLCSVDGGAVWPSGGKLLCYCWNLCWDMFPDLCFVGVCLMESGLQLWCSVW